MNNTNFTDNTNTISNSENFTIDTETGEVIENTEAVSVADNYTIHGYEPKHSEVSEAAKGGDLKKPKQIFFNAREWKPSKDCEKTVATRSFISDPFGSLTEAYTVGDWNWNWSQIETKDLILEKNTDYEFVFWLNGGENDRSCEVCRFEIIFDNDYENRYVYNLNRNYIRYIKHYKGWYLYSIPFNTEQACYTKFHFIAQSAYATIMKANPVESYNELPEDFPPEGVPQRHNIIFSEGFPRNSWWSNLVFSDLHKNNSEQKREIHINGADLSGLEGLSELSTLGDRISQAMQGKFGNADKYNQIAQLVRQRIEEELEDELDPDGLADELMDEIDVDAIRDQIIQQIKDSLK